MLKIKNISLILLCILLTGCGLFEFLPTRQSLSSRLATFNAINTHDFEKPVTVYWNDYQVPFIEALTDRDAAYTLGLVHAHLRLGQLEFGKRIASGRISEMVGPIATDLDAALRALDLNKAAPQVIANMPESTRDWMQAYVQGINDYKNHITELPHEMTVMSMKNEPWTIEDSLLLGRLGGVDTNWFSFINLLPKRQKKEWSQIWQRLEQQNSQTKTSFKKPETLSVKLPEYNKEKLAMLVNVLSIFAKSGSNSFAINATRSASAAPIIANDPHLGFTIPSIWLTCGLKSPSYHVVGMMAPGLPVFAFGRNQDIAWGGTNMRHEASDLVDVTELRKIKKKTHTIKRRFLWDKTAENRVHPKYGPIISDTSILPFPEGKDYALRWTGHLPSDEITAMLSVAKAKSWQEMHHALQSFSLPGQNFVFVDKNGDIGQILGTWIPKRENPFPKDLFKTPQESDRAWQTILTTKDLPYVVNPKNGIIASGNNKPFDHSPRIGWSFVPGDRVTRIYDYLQTKPLWTTHEIATLQQDAYSVSHVILRNALIDAAKDVRLSDRARSILNKFKNWDGQYKADSQTAYLFHMWSVDFTQRLYRNKTLYDAWTINNYITRFAAQDIQILAPEKRHQVIRNSLEKVAQLRSNQTMWGDIHRLRIQHVLGNIPFYGNRYRIKEIGVSGHNTTILKTSGTLKNEKHLVRYGSHARHISDFSDINDNQFVLFGGQDGWINAQNYVDQIPLWHNGTYIKVPYEMSKIRKTFNHKTTFLGKQRQQSLTSQKPPCKMLALNHNSIYCVGQFH